MAVVTTAACGTDDGGDAPATTTGDITTGDTTTGDGRSDTPTEVADALRVPGDFATIQEAVDSADPGSLILIAPGTYNESVSVETPDLTIRGEDRNTVILDGGDELENGIQAFSNGTTVENLTVHNYRGNGVLFSGSYGDDRVLDGFRASYVTVYNNGLYGVYAFAATNGQIDHIYGSGHPDAAVYVGQCQPCNTTVTDSVGELNAVGFQGTNAGGGLIVATSQWSRNRVGVQSISSTKEKIYPQRDADFVANLVDANNGDGAPQATEGFGAGITVSGGQANRIERNVVTGHVGVGIIVTSADEFQPSDNEVRTNTLGTNGLDLVFATADGQPLGNCFVGNPFASSSPVDIEAVFPCDPSASGGTGTLPRTAPPPNVDYRTMAAPPPQDQMPAADRAPTTPARSPLSLDLATLVAPVPT